MAQAPPNPIHHQPLSSMDPSKTDENDIEIESIDHESRKFQSHPNPPLSMMTNNNNNKNHLVKEEDQKSFTNKRYMPLLVINYLMLFVGSLSGSLLSKYYFIHKGSSKWVSTWVQCAGFPLLIIPICILYPLNLTKRKPFTDFTPKLLTLSIFVGFMLGVNNFLISWGVAYLPVSTSNLLLSSQLVFNLILSALIVKQKITFSNLNTVILLTLSSIILALNSSHEKPEGVTKKMYFVGFFCTIGAGLLFALYLPVVEKIYRKVYCYEMVVEMQLVMEMAATALATLGMTFEGGFSQMKEEGMRVFDKGTKVYIVTVMATVVGWQLCFMGTAGMVFMTSSLTGGICMTGLLSMNVLGGVVVYKDNFGGLKAVSTVLCIWGFCSYVYGLYVKMMKEKQRIMRNNSDSSTMELITIENHGGMTH